MKNAKSYLSKILTEDQLDNTDPKVIANCLLAMEEYARGRAAHLELQIDVILSGSSHDLQNEYADKWIKMESEEDLPKEENDYWVIDKEGIVSMDVWENLPFTDMNRRRNRKWVEHYSHYTPLIIPEPPKED